MSATLRIDKWLWYARFCKTRSLAQKHCASGDIRINGHAVRKPNASVKIGDEVSATLGSMQRTVVIVALPVRRGPASEAVKTFTEAEPPIRLVMPDQRSPLYRMPGSGRPTKRERRALEAFFQHSRSG